MNCSGEGLLKIKVVHACFDTVIADRGFESESESEIIFTKPMPCHSQDINECDTTNGRCEHSCTNTIGSFICSCDTGYQLDGNGLSCSGEGLRIDKLYSHDGMSQVCYFC